jgi:hypothetical protein
LLNPNRRSRNPLHQSSHRSPPDDSPPRATAPQTYLRSTGPFDIV